MGETKKLIESIQNNLNEEDEKLNEAYSPDEDDLINDEEDEYYSPDDDPNGGMKYDSNYGKIDEDINEAEDCIKEDEEVVDEFTEFKSDVEKAGGLYGYVANNYTSMPQELLMEIALNALYELNNDDKVIEDVQERYFDYMKESEDCIKEDENLELDENGLPVLDRPYQMKWVGDEDGEGYYLIDSIRPYNLTDYSYAKSTTNDYFGEWNVFNPEGEKVAVANNYKEALEVMKDIDSKLEAVIDKS